MATISRNLLHLHQRKKRQESLIWMMILSCLGLLCLFSTLCILSNDWSLVPQAYNPMPTIFGESIFDLNPSLKPKNDQQQAQVKSETKQNVHQTISIKKHPFSSFHYVRKQNLDNGKGEVHLVKRMRGFGEGGFGGGWRGPSKVMEKSYKEQMSGKSRSSKPTVRRVSQSAPPKTFHELPLVLRSPSQKSSSSDSGNSSPTHSGGSSSSHSEGSSPTHSGGSSPTHSGGLSSIHSGGSSPTHSGGSSSIHSEGSSPTHSGRPSSSHSESSSPSSSPERQLEAGMLALRQSPTKSAMKNKKAVQVKKADKTVKFAPDLISSEHEV